jgi:hypothetical protein
MVGRHERGAGIEPDVRVAGDERIVGEAFVLQGIGHDERLVSIEQRVGAERVVARRLADRQADSRLEPLPLAVHQTDERDGRLGDERRNLRDVVVGLLRVGVEDVVAVQRIEARLLRF